MRILRMLIPVVHALGFHQLAPDIVPRSACYNIYNRRANVSCVKSASGTTYHANASARRARERKPPLGFRGIIVEDDVSIPDGSTEARRNEVPRSLASA